MKEGICADCNKPINSEYHINDECVDGFIDEKAEAHLDMLMQDGKVKIEK